jgi:hypothetical protein
LLSLRANNQYEVSWNQADIQPPSTCALRFLSLGSRNHQPMLSVHRYGRRTHRKDFPVGKVNIQFRAEAFNLSNTPSFFILNNGSGSQEFGNAAFGQISQTDPNCSPRQLQFVLKVQF